MSRRATLHYVMMLLVEVLYPTEHNVKLVTSLVTLASYSTYDKLMVPGISMSFGASSQGSLASTTATASGAGCRTPCPMTKTAENGTSKRRTGPITISSTRTVMATPM